MEISYNNDHCDTIITQSFKEKTTHLKSLDLSPWFNLFRVGGSGGMLDRGPRGSQCHIGDSERTMIRDQPAGSYQQWICELMFED